MLDGSRENPAISTVVVLNDSRRRTQCRITPENIGTLLGDRDQDVQPVGYDFQFENVTSPLGRITGVLPTFICQLERHPVVGTLVESFDQPV